MNLSHVELPLELTELFVDFPRGIYEIETEGVDYEVVLDPVLNYVGSLIIDRSKGEPEPEDARQLSLVSFYFTEGEKGRIIFQDTNLELHVKETALVESITLISLAEETENSELDEIEEAVNGSNK